MPVTKSGLPEALRNMISSVKSSKGTISKEEVEERRKALAQDTDGMMKARKRLNSLPDAPSEYPGMSNSQLSKATSEILDSMSPKTRNQCVARMKARAFNAGEVIIEEGAIGTSMVRLLSYRRETHYFNSSVLHRRWPRYCCEER